MIILISLFFKFLARYVMAAFVNGLAFIFEGSHISLLILLFLLFIFFIVVIGIVLYLCIHNNKK